LNADIPILAKPFSPKKIIECIEKTMDDHLGWVPDAILGKHEVNHNSNRRIEFA